MATGTISTPQQSPPSIHVTTISNPKGLQGIRYLQPELYRLSTYRSWKENNHPNLSKGLLAKLGFSYTGENDKVKCETCGLEIESWTMDMNPMEEHKNGSPHCQFVLDHSDLFSKNDSLSTVKITQMDVSNDNHQSTMNSNATVMTNSTELNTFLDLLSNEVVDRARANTFSNWPLITPNAQEMVIAGWAYTNIADRVMCIYCDTLFHKWTETDRPYEIHRMKSPFCPFVLMTEKKEVNLPVANITITTAPNTQAPVDPANVAYSLAFRRTQSFEKWPRTEQDSLPSIESFVHAGFFYTGEKTIVRCFYCNGALRNWQATDDPKVEHARWYPQCAYIRQYIGEDLYSAIQRKNCELKAQQNHQETANGDTSKLNPWTPDEIDRMVKARLDLPVVEKLRQAGFSMAIIRKAYEMQLKFKKDDFKSDNDLRIACLMLDQQVKAINGNEGNILVPQDWMRKYTEDQQQAATQQFTTISQPEVKNIEAPKIVPPAVARPRIMQKTGEEAMPCLLCLTTERQVACLPCGHLTSCVACGHSLKTCPICRATVKAYVRIYV